MEVFDHELNLEIQKLCTDNQILKLTVRNLENEIEMLQRVIETLKEKSHAHLCIGAVSGHYHL
jgi:diphthamide synthase (EF-2-diphthine--ammonia ligase)